MGLEIENGRVTVRRVFRSPVSLSAASIASARFELQPLLLRPCPLTIRTHQGASIKVRGVSRKGKILPSPDDRNDAIEQRVDQFFADAEMTAVRTA
jgi:hypothetical protein